MRLVWVAALLTAGMALPQTATACSLPNVVTVITRDCDAWGFCWTVKPPKGAALIKLRLARAQELGREGKQDIPALLAKMLVPDVMPTSWYGSTCGATAQQSAYEAGYLSNKALNAVLSNRFGALPAEFYPSSEFIDRFRWLSTDCNDEFRASISAHLSQSVPAENLRHAWQYLYALTVEEESGRGDPIRIMEFASDKRVMPMIVRPHLSNSAMMTAFMASDPSAIAIVKAVERRWAAANPVKTEPGKFCPTAASGLSQLIEKEGAHVAKEVSRAARRTGQAQ